jgi:hypothetical protein
MIFTYADITAGMPFCAALSNNDVAANNIFATKFFYAKTAAF